MNFPYQSQKTPCFSTFFPIFRSLAVAHEKYRNHVNFPSLNALICRVLARFARFGFFVGIVKNVTKLANRGKTGQVDAVKSSKNVVGIGGFYYSGFFSFISVFITDSFFFNSLSSFSLCFFAILSSKHIFINCSTTGKYLRHSSSSNS